MEKVKNSNKWKYLINLQFADDIVLMSELIDDLQQKILQFFKVSHIMGLKINMKKTKLMFSNYILGNEIKIDDEVIKCIQKYIYLEKKIGAC